MIRSMYAGATVNANRFLKFGSADNAAIQAAASTDEIIGVSGALGGTSGLPFDVHIGEIAQVKCGGTITRGNRLTADSNGCAVVLSTAATAQLGGIALKSGVADDIIDVYVLPGVVSKAAA